MNGDPAAVIRIAGLMRSGTNLLTWVLRHNFTGVQTATMLLGWKHGPIHRDRAALLPEDYVDPRYRDGIRNFQRDHPGRWAALVASPAARAAAAAQRAQSFGVALAVRDPESWYASCIRVERESPGFLLHGTSPAEAAGFWNASHRSWLSTLGERSAIIDTDQLRATPGPCLDRLAAGLRIRRHAEVRLPEGYLHPRGTEEVYELLGASIEPPLEREFTDRTDVDPGVRAAFMEGLDPVILQRLGLRPGPNA